MDRRTGAGVEAFTYEVPEAMAATIVEGSRVVVPFGKRTVNGYVLELVSASDHPSPRALEALADEPSLLLPHQIGLARWVAHEYAAPLAEVVRAMIPPGIRSLKVNSKRPRGPRVESRIRSLARTAVARPDRELSPAQEVAVDAVRDSLSAGVPTHLLLHGVTASGKTEVYLEALEMCLASGRGAIVLLPEVSLTPQLTARFAERFSGDIAVLHSRLTPAERAFEWRRLRSGEARIAVGPRAAIFAPVLQLGLVVVDEEHSVTYKQTRVPRYNAVDVATKLGALTASLVLVGSATPSVVDYDRHGRAVGIYSGARVLELPQRHSGEPLPEVEVVDMRSDEGWSLYRPIGDRLAEAATAELERGGQVILYLNRRGLAWYARCRRCGDAVGCPNCSVSLVYHGVEKTLVCHYCGHSEPMPLRCPGCQAAQLRTIGFGTEKIEAEARRLFPGRSVVRLDRDTARTRDSYYGIWEAFAAGEGEVLVGTALVAKGWDLPRVGLVGIVDADQELHYPDFRAAESTFATLVQAGGRARRQGARVVVQTMNPHHYAIRLAMTHDYHGFFAEEIGVRQALEFPPFTRLVEVIAEASSDDRAKAMATGYADVLRESLLARGLDGILVMGPMPAFIHRLRGQFRWSLLVKGNDLEPVLPYLPDGRGFLVDVDPL
ncbi:MAG: replication restart helicase PriA [Candidatus Dormibacteria bacterium]